MRDSIPVDLESAVSARIRLQRYAWLSIAAALVTIALKQGAYWFTGSVGLLSDALESMINLVAGIIALVALSIAAREPDDERPHGYDKAEYFASGAEGGMILIAALAIAATALDRLLHPRPIESLGLGTAASVVASLVNLAVARVLIRAGRRHESITLEADGRHLLTDVWTTAGVVVGVWVAVSTGALWLDPLLALAVAGYIVVTGVSLIRRSAHGLMDSALPAAEQARIRAILDRRSGDGVGYHALRTRGSGARRFVSVHLLVPGHWTVQRGHDLAEAIEAEIRVALANAVVLTHLEPVEDPAASRDVPLDR